MEDGEEGPVDPMGTYRRPAQPLASLLLSNTALRVLDISAVVSFTSGSLCLL